MKFKKRLPPQHTGIVLVDKWKHNQGTHVSTDDFIDECGKSRYTHRLMEKEVDYI
jgi:hypothetical protein